MKNTSTDIYESAGRTLRNFHDCIIAHGMLCQIKSVEHTPLACIIVPRMKENFYMAMFECVQPIGIA